MTQPDVLQCIGNTSLVALRRIGPPGGARILVKLESENPTGSMKDRMALAMIEAAGRLVPGVVGNPESLVEESHEDGLLEYPSYTKPAIWRGLEVPPVLLSGHHGRVAGWRREQQLERTRRVRPELLGDDAPTTPE